MPHVKHDRVRMSAPAGERPQTPWHPLPLSELLILIGGVGAALGMRQGISSAAPLLLAGILAVALGTLEVTWREHRSGFRSHTLLLAFLPVVVLHTAVVLGVAAFTTPPRLLTLGLLAFDVALFAVLFRLLRARFRDVRVRAVSRR